MPCKIRELISELRKAGLESDRKKIPTDGSKHLSFQGVITLSGGEGDDAKTYQERQVAKAIADSKSEG